MTAKVSILIPNYKTRDLTELCLKLLKKHTSMALVDVICIDNQSEDASTDYLRTVPWIRLIERKAIPDEPGFLAHSRALDLGLASVTTPYVLSIHTDTFMLHDDWLPFLLNEIETSPTIAGVGSWKLELKPWYKSLAKRIEAGFQSKSKKEKHATRYLRSHCALYRTDLLRQHQLQFVDGSGVAGQAIHEGLIAHGFDMKFLNEEILLKYMAHVNHATLILNPQLGGRKKTHRTGVKRLKKLVASVND